LNIGIPPEVVAERVNASVKTIADHYDWASEKAAVAALPRSDGESQ